MTGSRFEPEGFVTSCHAAASELVGPIIRRSPVLCRASCRPLVRGALVSGVGVARGVLSFPVSPREHRSGAWRAQSNDGGPDPGGADIRVWARQVQLVERGVQRSSRPGSRCQ